MWMMIQRHAKSEFNAKMDKKKSVERGEDYYASLTDAAAPITKKEGVEQANRSVKFLQTLFDMYPQKGEVKAYSTSMLRGEETAVIQVENVTNVKWALSSQQEHRHLEVTHLLEERSFG